MFWFRHKSKTLERSASAARYNKHITNINTTERERAHDHKGITCFGQLSSSCLVWLVCVCFVGSSQNVFLSRFKMVPSLNQLSFKLAGFFVQKSGQILHSGCWHQVGMCGLAFFYSAAWGSPLKIEFKGLLSNKSKQ